MKEPKVKTQTQTKTKEKSEYIYRSFKFRIYPDPAQIIQIGKSVGCSRKVFNHFLGLWISTYESNPNFKGFTANDLKNMLPDLKRRDDLIYLAEVDSTALQFSAETVRRSFDNFFSYNRPVSNVWRSIPSCINDVVRCFL